MENQMTNKQQEEPSLSFSTVGNYIIIISCSVFIISLFLDWASAGGVDVTKGFGFMNFDKSKASGMSGLYPLTLLAAIGCILLCLPSLEEKLNETNEMVTPIIQIILSILGLLPFFMMLVFEMKTWIPSGRLEIGGWLALIAAFGLLIGAINKLIGIRQ